jgi:C1A family cysteine protease
LVVVAVALAIKIKPSQSLEIVNRQKFHDFQKKYNKNYKDDAEREKRFKIFTESMARAERLTQENHGSAQFGVTKFSDLTKEEFAQWYTMPTLKDKLKSYIPPPPKNFSAPHKVNAAGCSPDPTNFDWFGCGVCTPVYNQEQCGSCWAFSATETIESYFVIDGGQLTQLSMQQIVDCDTGGQDQGCNGGFPSGAYTYVEGANGLDPLSDYPYTAEDGTCADQPSEAVATVTNYNSISGEDGLYQQTSSSSGGPVSVCVDASSWQDYNGGVLTSCGNSVDHCVQLTGYANYGQSGDYWIVRNSWGADWGQSGFIWVAIGQDLCSIGDYATVVQSKAGKK